MTRAPAIIQGNATAGAINGKTRTVAHKGADRASGWDAVVRAAARCGYVAGLQTTPEGRLKSNAVGSRTLAETIAQGIVFTRAICADGEARRRENTADAGDARTLAGMPLRESARGPLELASIAWRELRDSDRTDPLGALVPVPHNDPLIAVRLTKRRVAEFDAAGPTAPPLGDYDARVWYIEIDRPAKGLPRALARTRIVDPDGETTGNRVCAIWTEGHEASFDRPLIVSLSWPTGGESAQGGAMRWPLPDERGLQSVDPAPIVAARRELLLSHCVPVLLHRAIGAWTQAKNSGREPATGGFERRRGRMRVTKGARSDRSRTTEYRNLARRLRQQALVSVPECPYGVEALTEVLPTPGTGLDAVLMAAARTADAAGGAPVDETNPPLWSERWWVRAEQGVVLWHMFTSPIEPGELVDSRFRQVALDIEGILQRTAPMAIKCAGEFIWQTLTQTQRAEVIQSRAPGTIHGLKVPPRLWRAIAEAGPHPELADIYAEDRWWYVEIETPAPGEPRAMALWLHREPDGTKVESGFGIWTEGHHASLESPVLIGWRMPPDVPARQMGWAKLDEMPYANGAPGPSLGEDVHDEFMAMAERALVGRESVQERVCAAITEHLTRGTSEPLALSADGVREANRSAGTLRTAVSEQPPPETQSIFALVRAPDPVLADAATKVEVTGKGMERGPPAEHHYVRAHFKRQAYGPKQSLRRVICIEGYWRGPEPDELHVVLERMSDERELSISTEE